ncbi:hypothetical protein DEAC_c20790 [Desulfosporosinus acididurans]|uniref:Uncharacterized protein n=1 Tax=Desulfosporosinus acididurans TaxID=476652 RepID=A0A0J1FRD9_9FIRM|nr:hypothetical protein [Desulfosporosinus acididurans]KLU66040.1 hypothetical protein DEAC_c20790 [Desulfosporosinus acididurans]
MAEIRYCELCKRNVEPTKKFNWLVFIFMCGIFYLPFYWMKKKGCPICGTSHLSAPKPE